MRLSWVEALVRARLGERKKAIERLDRVGSALLKSGPAHHAVAVMIDLAQLYSRRASDTDLRAIRRMIDRCLRLELESPIRKGLKKLKSVVSQTPEKAFHALARVRYNLVVPVKGLVSEPWRLPESLP